MHDLIREDGEPYLSSKWFIMGWHILQNLGGKQTAWISIKQSKDCSILCSLARASLGEKDAKVGAPRVKKQLLYLCSQTEWKVAEPNLKNQYRIKDNFSSARKKTKANSPRLLSHNIIWGRIFPLNIETHSSTPTRTHKHFLYGQKWIPWPLKFILLLFDNVFMEN